MTGMMRIIKKGLLNNCFFPAFIFSFFCYLLCFSPSLYAQSDEYREPPYWRQALGGAVIGNPVAQVESVVVATDGGNLKSYSSQGTPLWDFYARGRIVPFVGRSREGTSYVCRTNGQLMAVNRSGRELWRINLDAAIVSPVLTGWDGRLFVFMDKKITCLTAAGYTLWSQANEGKAAFAPTLDAAGGIIIVQEDGKMKRFDPFGNVFSYPLPSATTVTMTPKPVAATASLQIDGWGHSVLLFFEDRHIETVYPSLGFGEVLGSLVSSGNKYTRKNLELPASPLAAIGRKNHAAVLLKDGSVVLVSPEEKKIIWTGTSHIRAEELREIAENPKAEVQLLFDERGVYVLTKKGGTGFTPDGRRLWFTRINNAAAIAAFGDDGILYSGGTDWILYSYRIEDRVRAQQRLLYGEKSEGSYETGSPSPSANTGYHFRFDEAELKTRFAEIRTAIKDGQIGTLEKEYVALLMETAGSATGIISTNPEIKPAQTQHRVEAARLLAFLGSRETIPFLTDLFKNETDNLVKAAAAEAIGKIGVDPEGLALRAFENAVYPPYPLRDEKVMVTLAAAVGALCRFSGPPLSDAGVRLLTALSASGNPPSVQRRAQKEIGTL